jgi:Ca-activated chloride channel family protein
MRRVETKRKSPSYPARSTAALIALSIAAYLHGAPKQLSVPDSGELVIVDRNGHVAGACPLKHTNVQASISGPVGRVTVTQEFRNEERRRIEAIYTFPLPSEAAVDGMTMKVGEKQIRGVVKPREEANQIYEKARKQGSLASMLTQERPNIFTQSVANIGPNETVRIEITYVEMIPFEAGKYEFRFPMVVGPRYIPGNPNMDQRPTVKPTFRRIYPPPAYGNQGGGWSPNTDQVPDASRITPIVTPPGTRAGHDISLAVTLDAGVALTGIRCTTHEVTVERTNAHQAAVRLVNSATLPNKDFVLTYDVLGKTIGDAVLTHTDNRGKFLTLLLTPPERPAAKDIAPKELVFVLDTSGSMMGFPIAKAKEAMRASLSRLNPQDTFNLITFSGDTRILFPAPVPATSENLGRAELFLNTQNGGGGTEMMRAIRAALDPSDALDHVRVVCFMTDGYVGNDMEILSEVRKHQNARIFAFGIGSAVNHYLLDRMAAYGRGEAQYVGLQDDGSAAAERFTERVRNPILTDIHIDWGDLEQSGVYPAPLPDLFGAKPVAVTAKYSRPGKHVIRLRGNQGGHPYSREIVVNLPTDQPAQNELATLWARKKVEAIMAGDLSAIQRGTPTPEIRAAITQLGLDYNLITQFTSFIAVEQRMITEGGQPKRIDVPVEMAEGVSYEGTFGGPSTDMIAVTGASPRIVTGGFVAGNASLLQNRAQDQFAPLTPPEMAESRVHVQIVPQKRDPEKPLLALKLHKTLLSILNKMQAGQTLSAAEAVLVRNGMVAVRIQFSGPVNRTKLAELGFKIVSADEHFTMKGTIAVKDLPQLATLSELLFVSPV